ncbi:hypothetical protein ACTFIY_006432 [Dictyostelium cf. discoideum]
MTLYVCKTIKFYNETKDNKIKREREYLFLKQYSSPKFSHLNIAKYIQHFETRDNEGYLQKLSIIIEYYEGGDLTNLKNLNEVLPKDIIYLFFLMLVILKEFKHSIIHRDIKPDQLIEFVCRQYDQSRYTVSLSIYIHPNTRSIIKIKNSIVSKNVIKSILKLTFKVNFIIVLVHIGVSLITNILLKKRTSIKRMKINNQSNVLSVVELIETPSQDSTKAFENLLINHINYIRDGGIDESIKSLLHPDIIIKTKCNTVKGFEIKPHSINNTEATLFDKLIEHIYFVKSHSLPPPSQISPIKEPLFSYELKICFPFNHRGHIYGVKVPLNPHYLNIVFGEIKDTLISNLIQTLNDLSPNNLQYKRILIKLLSIILIEEERILNSYSNIGLEVYFKEFNEIIKNENNLVGILSNKFLVSKIDTTKKIEKIKPLELY